ncbi:AAA family ATPase [Siminovitchia acidinfaciens]|uniref:HTH-type transcriptional regulatory protein TyrR n=1 Tax=Siminovitchia acidinfaciens TaxID=2321395 RepID=A0A429Y7Y3_9BACI|nr:sigma 54-interacting transcriptional regulator [Siminovitchia acidinfaciens]RST77493.1 AAA family ATPase [Siminovitchia acidinfaciens]
MKFSFKIEIIILLEKVGVIKIKSLSLQTNKSFVNALQSTLLKIYDEIIITDIHGKIKENFGKIKRLWGDRRNLIGMNLFEIEKQLFHEELPLEDFNNEYKRSIIKTSWNNKRVLVTCYPDIKTVDQEYITWGFKVISRNDSVLMESNTDEKIDFPSISKKETSRLFVMKSQSMMKVLSTVEMVAKVSSSVLLLGESGVGKEVIARAIHDLGPRKNQPFIPVNCGAIPDNLLESELFGYVDGAFSGAKKEGVPGKFELANNGVLFLDEIGEMPLNLQVKLLRVLQEREITPLGSSKSIKLDIQIIAATNKNIKTLVEKGQFREDLYYRLNVIPIEIPPLRERFEELPYLINFFLHKYNNLYDRSVQIEQDAIDHMSIYEWPGNVRQLENTIERIVVTCTKPTVDASAVQEYVPIAQETVKTPPVFDHLMPLQDAVNLVEEQLITMAMEKYKSLKLAAKALNVSQPTMSRKYKRILNNLSKQNIPLSEKRKILEEQLNNRLRSVAIATAAIIETDEVMELRKNPSVKNPIFLKIQKQLTMVIKQEGGMKWAFIFEVIDNETLRTIAGDKDFVMQPGDLYEVGAEFAKVARNAMKGRVEVTPVYRDVFGEWKSCLAPVMDQSGQVIALIGYDYSKEYVEAELSKMGKVLKINI